MSTIPMLMYHSVNDASTKGFRQFTVTPVRFAEQLAALAAAGWRTVTFADAVEMLHKGQRADHDRVVAVTVDDGLADFYSHALPVLATQRARATIFVPTAHVGRSAQWLGGEDSRRPLLDWRTLADVAAMGIEVGSHGHLHVPLDVGKRDDVFQDLARSRLMLEDRLGVEVRTLAFPFGYETGRSRQAAERAGFRAACVITDLPAVQPDPMLALPRLAVRQEMTGADLVHAVERHYGAWERSWRRGKQRLWETARRARVVGPKPWAGPAHPQLTAHADLRR